VGFLVAPETKWIQGANFPVDGGLTAAYVTPLKPESRHKIKTLRLKPDMETLEGTTWATVEVRLLSRSDISHLSLLSLCHIYRWIQCTITMGKWGLSGEKRMIDKSIH
jgi:hypothetical protein